MHNFKKVLSSFIVFCLIISVASGIVVFVFFNTESAPYQDIELRNQLAGSINTLLLGSSEGMVAFDSTIIDKELNAKSYNLCGSACPPSGIKALLEEEIDRNPLKTVIVDIGSFLHYDYIDSVSEGEIKVIPRLSDNSVKIKYMLKNVWIDNYGYLYATYMNNGISTLKNLLLGSYVPAVTGQIDEKQESDTNTDFKDLSISNEEIILNYVQDKTASKEDFWGNPELRNYELLKSIIEKCNEKRIKVILVFVPTTESRIWTSGNFETENEFYNKFAENNNCVYWNFNLLKNRNNYFSDKTSFRDNYHMSASGSQAFMNIFCDIIKRHQLGKDVSDMFYSSYDEAIKHFEYYEIYQSLMKEQN